LLVYGGDTKRSGTLRVVITDGCAIDFEFAAVRRDCTGYDFDQRGFTGSILADKGVNFAGLQVKRGAFKRLNARKRFVYGSRANERQGLPTSAALGLMPG